AARRPSSAAEAAPAEAAAEAAPAARRPAPAEAAPPEAAPGEAADAHPAAERHRGRGAGAGGGAGGRPAVDGVNGLLHLGRVDALEGPEGEGGGLVAGRRLLGVDHLLDVLVHELGAVDPQRPGGVVGADGERHGAGLAVGADVLVLAAGE